MKISLVGSRTDRNLESSSRCEGKGYMYKGKVTQQHMSMTIMNEG